MQASSSELKLEWRRGKDIPFQISDYPSMVLLQGKVYIGGGYTHKDVDKVTVIAYNPLEGSCSILPPYTYMLFSMAVVKKQLILVGGGDFCKRKTNKLGVWNEQLRKWTHPFPPMTTACSRPTVVTHKDRWLIVIGGGSDQDRLSRVEILDSSSKQWYHSTPMPHVLACEYTLTTSIGNVCYLLGGYTAITSMLKRVVSVRLDDLISQAISDPSAIESAPTTPSPWQTLPDVPLNHSTPLAVNGALLAVGGFDVNAANTMYAYLPNSKEWIKAGEMPAKRAFCSCIILPNGEIMVSGSRLLGPAHVSQQIHLASVV